MTRGEVSDWRALSLLETEQPSPVEVAGGIAFALAVFVVLPTLVLLSGFLLGGMQTLFGGVDELRPAPIEVIETRFVRLGKKRPERRLPSKEVPAAQQSAPVPTAPDSSTAAAVASGKSEKGLSKPKKRRSKLSSAVGLSSRTASSLPRRLTQNSRSHTHARLPAG